VTKEKEQGKEGGEIGHGPDLPSLAIELQ